MFNFKFLIAVPFVFSTVNSLSQPSFDDRSAQLDAQLLLVQKEAQLLAALRSSAGASISSLPSVVSIMGFDGQLSARLQQANGVVRNYREGESIQSGIVVSAITPRTVTVAVGQGKKAKVVELQALAGATAQFGAQQGGGAMPAGSPIPVELLPAPPYVPVPGAQPAMPRGPVAAAKQAAPAPASAQVQAPASPASR